jgi:RNA polymerase sigma-70 factor (ECF subfamily)
VSSQQAEFAEFFQASWEPCLRAVVAVAGARQPAEDQVAEAFARAWASWRKVRQHPAPQAWVVRTALNTGASWWRRRNRELPLADHELAAPAGVDGDPASGLDSGPGSDPGAGLNDALLAAIRRLPQRQREVIALRMFLDLDTATMARELGIEAGTVRMHLSRGVAALRRELTPTRKTEAGR